MVQLCGAAARGPQGQIEGGKMRRFRLPSISARTPKRTSRQPRSKRDLLQLARRELVQPLGDTMQGFEDRVYHKAGLPHGGAAIKRKVGTKSPATDVVPPPNGESMPVRENDPYKPDEVRAAIQAALDRAGVSKSGVGKDAGLADRTIGKFLNDGSKTIYLANAIRLAHRLGITVSELIGEVPPATASSSSAMSDEEINAWQDRLLRMLQDLQAFRALPKKDR